MRARAIFSAVVAAILFAGGMVLAERNGDPAGAIQAFESKLESAFQRKPIPTPPGLEGKVSNIFQIAPSWADVESLASELTWSNRKTAEARAMLRYETRPESVYSFEWETRDATAQRHWQIEENFDFEMRRVGTAAVAAAVGFGASFGALLGCSWLWGALLRRVRELSNAVKGRE